MVDERLRFVFAYERHEQTMVELCRAYGIARETGYFWLRRYQEQGVRGLLELNRAPHRHPNQTPVELEEAIVSRRRAHMTWGPRKLKRLLLRDEPTRKWPAASTIGELLKREGLVLERRSRRRTPPYTQPLGHADSCNRVWCADFKGWFPAQNGERIDPLTISDAYSRYLLRCQTLPKSDTERVQAIFEAAFRVYGLPEAIRTDNGPPFASQAIGGLSRLAVWWIKLGIRPERIAAGHPEQNGRHERMHRTLKQEVEIASDRRAQQRALDRFRYEYNEVRPHQALDQQTPASVYMPSEREYPERVPEIEYPDALLVRTVQSKGQFHWKDGEVFLTQVLWGERIGLLPVDGRWYRIYFGPVALARFDGEQRRVLPLPAGVSFVVADAGAGDVSPSPAPLPLDGTEVEKLSGMCPV